MQSSPTIPAAVVMYQPPATPSALKNIPAEIWFRIVDILVHQELTCDTSKRSEPSTIKRITYKNLAGLMYLIRVNRQLHFVLAPYIFSKFSGRILLWAAETGRRQVAEDAIAAGAPIEVRNQLGQTPLLLAAKNGYTSIVELLLGENADQLPTCPRPIESPEKCTERKCSVALLPSKSVNIDAADEKNMTPLGEATRQGHQAVARLLLLRGASITARMQTGQTPLHLAASVGSRQIVEMFTLLYATHVNWNMGDIHGCSPMFLAAANGHASMIEFLQLHGANAAIATHGNQTPLHIAAANGHKKAVKTLLRLSRMNSFQKDRRGCTPAHLAAKSGHVLVVISLCSTQRRKVLTSIHCLNVAVKNRFFSFDRSQRVLRRIRRRMVRQ